MKKYNVLVKGVFVKQYTVEADDEDYALFKAEDFCPIPDKDTRFHYNIIDCTEVSDETQA